MRDVNLPNTDLKDLSTAGSLLAAAAAAATAAVTFAILGTKMDVTPGSGEIRFPVVWRGQDAYNAIFLNILTVSAGLPFIVIFNN